MSITDRMETPHSLQRKEIKYVDSNTPIKNI